MIVIDMDMPKTCDECAFFDGEDMCYADGTFALSQSAFENRPKWCPIKCNIEDIKQEILDKDLLDYERVGNIVDIRRTRDYILGVIDKHIKGDADA